MIKFYFHPRPNPIKVALYLEETGTPYELVPVDTLKGEQHKPEFRAINPNGKTPAIDDDGVRVFDSNAILLPPFFMNDSIKNVLRSGPASGN